MTKKNTVSALSEQLRVLASVTSTTDDGQPTLLVNCATPRFAQLRHTYRFKNVRLNIMANASQGKSWLHKELSKDLAGWDGLMIQSVVDQITTADSRASSEEILQVRTSHGAILPVCEVLA